jgi:hypothetical protein
VRALLAVSLIVSGFTLGNPAAIAAEPVRILEAAPEPAWDARFQRTSGWLGADGNYSIRIAPDRVLWFFSDTLVGRIEDGRRVETRMINNSVGVQTGRAGEEVLEFFYQNQASGQPQSLFRPETPGHWEWLVGGTAIEGRVHLFLWEFRKSSDPGVFGFELVGVNQVEIENPLDRPTDWKSTRRRLPCTEFTPESRISFGSAVLSHGEFVYIYGVRETPQQKFSPKRMILARVRATSITEHSAWEFWTPTGWSPEFRDAATLVSGVASEYSVSYQPDRQQFILISHHDLLSPKIQLRTADAPSGPWSDPVEVWTCPEPASKKGYFAYSAKAHPEISSSGELLITYAVNSFQFGDLFSDPKLYWPRFVRVRLSPP